MTAEREEAETEESAGSAAVRAAGAVAGSAAVEAGLAAEASMAAAEAAGLAEAARVAVEAAGLAEAARVAVEAAGLAEVARVAVEAAGLAEVAGSVAVVGEKGAMVAKAEVCTAQRTGRAWVFVLDCTAHYRMRWVGILCLLAHRGRSL